MDQAPKLPPRPEKTNTTTMTPLQRHQAMVAQMKASRKMNIGGAGDQAELLTVVPPPPAPSADAVASVATPPNAGHMFSFAVPSASSSSSSRTRSQHLGVVASTSLPSSSSSASSASPSPTLNPVPLSPSRVPSSVFNSFQENVLYSMEPSISEQISTNGSTTQPNILSPPTSSSSSSSSSSAKRPTRITPSNSLPGSALIDLNSLNNNNSSVNDEESARREKARQMIKSMVSAQQQQQLVVSPMFAPATSPLSVVPINVPSMSSAYPQTATLPLGINLVANPLYSNQLAAGSPTKLTAAFTNNSAAAAAAIYANLINNNHNNSSHMINTTTTYPIPINHHHQLHHHLHQNIAINHLYFNTQLQQQQQQQQAYSNWAMIHQQQQQQPSASSFASSTSAASASSPLYSSISTNFQDPIYMNEIFSKIQNNSNSNNSSAAASVQGSPARGVAVDANASSSSSSPPHLKSVLTPTSVFDIRKYTTSQSVIDLFDPLAEVESTTDGQTPSPEYARAARTSSPIPPPPAEKSDAIKNRCLGEAVVPAISVEEDSSEEDEHSVAKKEDEVNNNNNSRSDRGEAVDGSTSPTTTSSSKRHSYTNVNDEPINLLYVEERSAKYSPEMQEFCDHLRALYLTVGSAKSTNGASSSPEAPNSGLVWSPRIDMSRAGDKDGGGNSFSLDMYMCSPATKRQLAALNNTSLNSSLSSSVSYSDESEQSERSAIFDVKFNALVYAKLTGEKAPDFSSSLGQQQQPSWHSKKLTCALDNVVDIIIYNLATFYGGDGKSEVNYEDFLLKVSGRNEYLVPRSQLASYVYIQQCKKMGQDVTLELVDQTATEFWRPYLRTEADTEYITSARFTPDELLPREAVAAFAGTASAHALNGVLEKLNLSMAKFLSLATIDAVRAREGVAVFRELTAQIQALTSILSHVFTTRLYRAIDALLRYHRRHIADFGSGSGGVISSQELMATFTSLAQEVLKAAAEVIHLFSVTFPVNWALPFKHAPRLPPKKEDITRQVESFKLRLDAVCQVAPEWKPAYGWFCLRVVIAHGFSVLEYKYTERKVVDMEHWRLEFDRELVFDTIIANLPREARVDFQLLGIKGSASMGGSSGTVGAGSKLEVDILAATFFYLFEHENVDERHLFRIGAHLLPLTPFKPPLSIFKSSQSSLSSSNPNQSSAAAIYSFEQLDAHVPVIDDSNYVVGYHLAPKAPMIVFSIRQNKPAVQYYYPKVGGGGGGNQNSQRTSSQLEASTSTFARSTFDRASLRLDTRVPLTLDRSDSVVSNGSSQGSIGGGGGGLHDQLYGFYGRSTECLEAAERAKIISVIQANPLLPLAEADRALLLKNAEALARFPGAILKLLKAPRWAHGDVRRTYQLLDSFDYFAIHNSSVVTSPQITTGSSAVSPLKMSRSMSFDAAGNASQSSSKQLPFLTAIEALQLLAADYPDRNVRLKAVRWLKHVSPDELCDFLPQLVQSLRYEPYLDCSLIWLLYECALSSSRFCHHLYWLLKSCREGDGRFGGRAAFYLNGLLALCGRRARAMFERQEQLGGRLEAISEEVKAAKDSAKAAVLRQRLETVHEFLECCPISIPLSPSLQVSGLELPQCSYFSSFSRPLKIVLHAAPPYCTSAAQLADAVGPTRPNLMAALYGQRKQLSKIIFKAGDDLRQDMLVMQIVSIINRLWLRAGLDLRLITFAVVNTAHRTGMIEMVSRARTLCQIQREYGVAGNFKRHTISQWLKRHNSGEFEYQMACENFVHSCAGYVVISYLLGFGDRHNDNIMVTTSGHLFHIDFGKFLGKAQTMAGFKRDRAPFVFTADMAYVINGESDRSGKSFQYFVDLCCTCFSQVRANGNFLLSLLAMMIPSSIEGLTPETIMYFHHALMPAETDSKAKEGFYRLIRESLDSFGTQFNFFIHSLAQMKLSGTGGGGGGSSAAQVENQNYVVIPGGNTVESGPNENGDVSDGNGGGGGKSNGDNMMDSGMASLESSENSVWRFSFSSTRFSRSQGTEGEITRLEIVSIWKRPPAIDEALGRDYLYKVLVSRATVPESLVYRSYREFGELHERLTRVFPLVRFETAGRGRRPTSATAAEGAKRELQTFLNRLLSLAHEISHSDIVYTFFHAYHRDQQYLDLDRGGLGGGLSVSDFGASASTVSLSSSSSASALPPRSSGPLLPGKIKLAISYSSDGRLNVLVMYARNLVADRNSSPDTYVKLYLLPDPEKRTKRKTKVASKNANPTFMESISYPEMELKELRARKLEVSVWAYDISGNSRIGATMVDLATLDLESKTERWYKLFSAGAAAMQM